MALPHKQIWTKVIYTLLALTMVLPIAINGYIVYLNNKPPTANELNMKIIKEGAGKVAKVGDNVSVLYKGSLLDGTVFDASDKHNNQTLDFTVGAGQLIKGFDAAVVGMKEGEKIEVTLPPDMAYGDKAVGSIPANSTLVFEIELVKIN